MIFFWIEITQVFIYQCTQTFGGIIAIFFSYIIHGFIHLSIYTGSSKNILLERALIRQEFRSFNSDTSQRQFEVVIYSK